MRTLACIVVWAVLVYGFWHTLRVAWAAWLESFDGIRLVCSADAGRPGRAGSPNSPSPARRGRQ